MLIYVLIYISICILTCTKLCRSYQSTNSIKRRSLSSVKTSSSSSSSSLSSSTTQFPSSLSSSTTQFPSSSSSSSSSISRKRSSSIPFNVHNKHDLYSSSIDNIDKIISNSNIINNNNNNHNNNDNNNNNNLNELELINLFNNINDNDEFIITLKNIHIKKPYGLSYKEKQYLSHQLLLRIKSMSPKSVAITTWCVGTLKIPKRGQDIIHISDMLIDQLTIYKSKLNSEEISMALVGLARLGIKMSTHTSNTFLDVLPRLLPIMSEHDLSNAVWAMGKIGILWDHLPLKLQKALGLSISQKSLKMTPQSVATTIHGLSNQRARWESLPIYLRDSLEEALRRTVNTMKELEISNTISGLGRLGAQWINIPTVVRYALTGAFLRTIDELGSKGLTMSIHGLGRMNADFSNLPPSFRDSIMLAIHTIAPQMNPQEISNVIYGLGKTDVHMNSGVDKVGLSKKARNGLLDALTREAWQLTAQGIANSLWGFMLMDTNWHILPSNVQKCILQTVAREISRMDEQQIGNTIFALSCMGLTWKEIPSTMRKELSEALEEKCSFLEPAGVVMTLLGFGKMQLTWSSIEPKLKNALSEAISRTLLTASDRTVSTTVHALATLNAKWNKLETKLKTSIEEAIARSYWDLHRTVQSSSTVNLNKQSDFSDIISLLRLSEVPSTSSIPSQLLTKAKLLTLKSSKAAELLLSPISDIASVEKIASVNTKNSPSTSILIPKSWSKKRTDSTFMKNNKPKKEDAVSKVGSQMHQNPLIYSLGQIGIVWDEMGFSSQTTLSNVIVSTIGTMNEHGVVNTLYGLSQVGAKWNTLRSDVRDAIQEAIQRISVDMGEKGVAVAVLSLAKIEVSWTEDLSEESKDALRLAITQQAHYGEHALSSVLYGFGKMNQKWDHLNPVVRQTLKEAIVVCHLNDRCTPQGVANSLHGLAQMQTEWSSLSSSVRLALLKEVFKAVPHATVHQTSSIILSLSKLGCNWDRFPADLRQELSKQIIKFSDSMNEQNLSNTLFALGSMGIQWVTMEAEMKNALVASLSRTTISATPYPKDKKYDKKKFISSHPLLEIDYSKTTESRVFEMKAQGISMVIVGLGRLSAGWASIPLKLAITLEKYVAKYAGEMTAGQLASTIGGLGKCMWRWSTLQEKTRKSLLAAVTKMGPSFSATDVSLIAHGLGSLGALWDELSVDVHQSLLQGARRVAKTGTPSEVAGVVFGLGLMECAWNKIAEKPRNDLTQGIIRVCSSHSPNVVGTNANNWLYSDSKIKIEMCPQAAANLMYALSILVFDTQDSTTHRQLAEVHIALLDLIPRIGIGKFSEAEREQILIYLNLLQTLVPAKHFYQTKANNFIIKADKPRPEPSKLQLSVVQSLTESLTEGLQVTNEYSGFGGIFPVDATIFEDGTALAFVEVDGPHHYIHGQLRRKDRLKESLYRSKYPEAAFTRVSFDQVKRLGSSYVGAEVAKFINIVKNHRCSNEDTDKEICGWVTRQTERELAAALSFGIDDIKKLNVLRSFDSDNYDCR